MEEKNNVKAIVSLVAGIVGVLFLFYPDAETVKFAFIAMLVFGLVSTILGFMAKSDIKKTPQKGKGLATAGVVLGIIAIVMGLLGFAGLSMFDDPETVNKVMCPMSTNCVVKEDGNYTCDYYGNTITCNKESVSEKNMKSK